MAEELKLKPELECELLKIIGNLAEECLISKLETPLEEVPNFEAIMLPTKAAIEEKLNQIIKLLRSSQKLLNDCDIFSLGFKKSMVPLILLVGEQQDSNRPWSSKNLANRIDVIVTYIRNIVISKGDSHEESTEATSVNLEKYFLLDLQSVVSTRKSLFFLCLQFLRPRLKRDTWKLYPAAATAFLWLITQIKPPYLSDYVGDILSPSLLFTDDYNDENKIQGISCLDVAIHNLTKTDLLTDNWGLVLYNALVGIIHTKSPIVLDKFMPLLISVMKIIEVEPNSNSHIFTKYDETMRKVLLALECCSENDLRLMWLHHLSLFLEVMGHATLHWRDKINEILLPFTTMNEPLLWKAILTLLQVLIRNTWLKPDSPANAEIILRLLFNCSVLDFPNISKEELQQIIKLSQDTLSLMSKCSDFDIVKVQIDEMKKDTKFHKNFLNVLQNL